MANTFRNYEGFAAAWNEAASNARDTLGPQWHLDSGTVCARVPATWVACKVFGRVSRSPRDMHIPAACFWPANDLPVGPEYPTGELSLGATILTPEEIAELVAETKRQVANDALAEAAD